MSYLYVLYKEKLVVDNRLALKGLIKHSSSFTCSNLTKWNVYNWTICLLFMPIDSILDFITLINRQWGLYREISDWGLEVRTEHSETKVNVHNRMVVPVSDRYTGITWSILTNCRQRVFTVNEGCLLTKFLSLMLFLQLFKRTMFFFLLRLNMTCSAAVP